jgi:glycosyltransferase involved in cell wall biosynthesis
VDSAIAVSDAVAILLEDAVRRAEMGEAGRRRSKEFTIATTVRRYESLYRAALAERS